MMATPQDQQLRAAIRVAADEMAAVTGRPDASHYFGTTEVVKGNPVWTGKMVQAPEHILLEPLRRRKPTMYFVNSMSDLFHEDVPDEWIDQVFAVMALCPQHTFQVLTKRNKRMREYCSAMADRRDQLDATCDRVAELYKPGSAKAGGELWANWFSQCCGHSPLPNVWLGVSAEDQARWDERYPDLFETPATVRFASFEPLIGRIDLCESLGVWWNQTMQAWEGRAGRSNVNSKGQKALHWAITGGESGPGHRTLRDMEPFQHIRRMAQVCDFAFFFKQDSHNKPGQRGRASDELWACKEMPL